MTEPPDPKLVADLAVALTRDHFDAQAAKARSPKLEEPHGSIMDAHRRERDTAEATVREMRRHLHGHLGQIARKGFKTDEARRMLRLEVDHDAKCLLFASEYMAKTMQGMARMYDREGPIQLDGFDVYVVDKLPTDAKGWRVINPFNTLP